MPGGAPSPAEPLPPDPELLRRRERLDLLVRIGFWTTASSVVVLMPMCMGCGFLMPAWAAPLVFLPAPIVFVLGGSLFITAQVLANRVRCDVCATWAEAGAFSDPQSLRQCPTCGRWAVPGAARAWEDEEGLEKGRGFAVILPGDGRASNEDQEERPQA